MNKRYVTGLIIVAAVFGCAAGVDVDSMLRDFDDYDADLQMVAITDQAMRVLEDGRKKRVEAASLIEAGKKAQALPVIEQALADARAALELDRRNTSARRAEQCRLQVEQARTKWREAIFVLEQTENFVGRQAPVSKREPAAAQEPPVLPASTLTPGVFPPASFDRVAEQWAEWRDVAREQRVAVADIESTYRRSHAQVWAEDADTTAIRHYTYVGARVVQSLESRVRAHSNERVCLEATQLTSAFGDARAEALQATLDLERGLQDDLRGELEQLRAEAKTRQDELFDALSQMEGKFARIRRDARGTIVSLADILFDFDRATLRRDVEFNLVKIAAILNQFEEMGILIEGHTDSVGTDEYNFDLSRRRAKAVYEFLISQDVDEDRLNWEGYGETRPVADNETEEGRQRNRRVDLVIQDT